MLRINSVAKGQLNLHVRSQNTNLEAATQPVSIRQPDATTKIGARRGRLIAIRSGIVTVLSLALMVGFSAFVTPNTVAFATDGCGYTADNVSYQIQDETLKIEATQPNAVLDKDFKTKVTAACDPETYKFTKIVVADNGNTLKFPADSSSLFKDDKTVTSITFGTIDTSAVTNMSQMFQNTDALSEIKGIEKFNTGNVTNMANMFSRENKPTATTPLIKFDLKGWDTKNVTNMNSMFTNFPTQVLDLEGWDARKVTDMGRMFSGLSRTVYINLSDWKVDPGLQPPQDFIDDYANMVIKLSGQLLAKLTGGQKLPARAYKVYDLSTNPLKIFSGLVTGSNLDPTPYNEPTHNYQFYGKGVVTVHLNGGTAGPPYKQFHIEFYSSLANTMLTYNGQTKSYWDWFFAPQMPLAPGDNVFLKFWKYVSGDPNSTVGFDFNTPIEDNMDIYATYQYTYADPFIKYVSAYEPGPVGQTGKWIQSEVDKVCPTSLSAESCTVSADGKTLTIKNKPGYYWSDGVKHVLELPARKTLEKVTFKQLLAAYIPGEEGKRGTWDHAEARKILGENYQVSDKAIDGPQAIDIAPAKPIADWIWSDKRINWRDIEGPISVVKPTAETFKDAHVAKPGANNDTWDSAKVAKACEGKHYTCVVSDDNKTITVTLDPATSHNGHSTDPNYMWIDKTLDPITFTASDEGKSMTKPTAADFADAHQVVPGAGNDTWDADKVAQDCSGKYRCQVSDDAKTITVTPPSDQDTWNDGTATPVVITVSDQGENVTPPVISDFESAYRQAAVAASWDAETVAKLCDGKRYHCTASGNVITIELTNPAVDNWTAGPAKIQFTAATVDVVPAEVIRGEKVVITATGFTAGTDVAFTLHSEPLALGKVPADNSGKAVLADVVIPESVALGSHEIWAVQSTVLAKTSLVVKLPATTPSPTPSATSSGSPTPTATSTPTATTKPAENQLPDTGVDANIGGVATALMLLLAGGALLRKRRH